MKSVIASGLFVLLWAGLAVAETSRGELAIGPGELRIVPAEGATPVEQRAIGLFVSVVRHRTGLEISIGDSAPAKYSLVVGTGLGGEPINLGPDGFLLVTTPHADGRLYLTGQSPSGVVAGIGKLLRLARYDDRLLTLPCTGITASPEPPVRGIYFATHFNNFYHVAPLEEIDRIIEDFALWGGNSLTVWFDMHHFKSFSDPAAQAHLARLRHLGETAHGLGMQFGLAFLANEAYNTSPQELRAKWIPGWSHYHVELCPSKPEGLALIGQWQAEQIAAFPSVDFIWTWPYDQGGCACERCMPWGGNGFLRASEQLARLYHERFPKGKVWLSTWLFDSPAGSKGDYDGLFRDLRDKPPSWLTGIIGETHAIKSRLAGRPAPDRYPLVCFPEISMYQMSPWGGYGANPLPAYCAKFASDVRGRVQGGWPYSEGIYEDVNKFFWSQFCWAQERPADDILKEYASYYLSPEAADDAVRLFHLMEQTHPRNNWRVRNLAGADEAARLVQAMDARLPQWSRTSWRWRILYVRAAMDQILKEKGYLTPEAHAALKPLCDEIVRIYHAERTSIRPPAFPKPKETGNLAFGRAVIVSSTHPECSGSERMLTDGILSQDDPQDFWAHDPKKEKTASLVLDLGASREIAEVQLQFRGIYGEHWFIPTRIGIEVSEDGKRFEQIAAPQDLPREGSAYSPKMWTCKVGRKGRTIRLTLGPSQHEENPYAGTLELTEIEVYGR